MARPQLCLFSKHAAQLDYAGLGRIPRQMGFDGIDLTVRDKGHVLPPNAARDLPKAVEAIRAGGLSVPMITTNLLSTADPTARPILETAGRLKIPLFKLGYHRYKGAKQVETTLIQVKRDTAALAELGHYHGLTAGFHNHSGDYVGAAVWDVRDVITPLAPNLIGYYFDPAHATIEGGLAGWAISTDVVLPRLKMVAVKDFYWGKDAQGRWRVVWCPMGEGMVQWDKFFAMLAAAQFAGPISLHVEYETPDEMAAIARDLEFLKRQVSKAYGSPAKVA